MTRSALTQAYRPMDVGFLAIVRMTFRRHTGFLQGGGFFHCNPAGDQHTQQYNEKIGYPFKHRHTFLRLTKLYWKTVVVADKAALKLQISFLNETVYSIPKRPAALLRLVQSLRRPLGAIISQNYFSTEFE